MEIDTANQLARMSVGEFARFGLVGSREAQGNQSHWRALVGQKWHSTIQSQSDAANEGMQNEVPIDQIIGWKHWSVHLQGRIDQYKETETLRHIREIKTVNRKLPLQRDEIEQDYPHYILQVLAYRELLIRSAPDNATPWQLELLFVEIETGLTQRYHLLPDHDALFADQLDQLAGFFDAKRERLENLRSLKDVAAYAQPRAGQETIQTDLVHAFESSPIVCLEAPTGYGKTGVAWEYALKALANGRAERVIYLTSKTTGQIEATHRLTSLLENERSLGYWNIRNKREHCIHTEYRCSPSVCPYLENIEEKLAHQGSQRLYLFSQDQVDIEAIRDEGRRIGVCPYEITRSGLAYRDVWIGDYNYLFSPQSKGLFENQIDYTPAKTLLIVDEAHNLASRVKANYSFEVDIVALNTVLGELESLRIPTRICNLVIEVIDLASHRRRGDKLSDAESNDFIDSILALSDMVLNQPFPFEDLSEQSVDTLWGLATACQNWKDGLMPFAVWVPRDSCIALTCLDAAPIIENILGQFHSSLLLSATLSPFEQFSREIGIEQRIPAVPHLQPPAPWRDQAYDVAIDLRADTRFRSREQSAPIIADDIAQLIATHGTTAVFFPSYTYAKSIAERIGIQHPELGIQVQPQGGSLQDRRDFIEHGLLLNDALFLILGSSFAEGIDLLGGKLKVAAIVSPALPEVNALRDAELQRHRGSKADSFNSVYLRPGIQKINQALGRLIRAPGQNVKVLLICNRFAEAATQNLLDAPYRRGTLITESDDLANWLESSNE